MKYFKLMYDYENDADKVVCFYKDMYGIDRYDVQKGCLIKEWDNNFTLYFNPDEGEVFTDYLGNSLGWFIVSSRFKNVMEEIDPNGVQYLPITVSNIKNHMNITSYYLANLCTLCNALDLNASKYDEIDIDGQHKMLMIEFHALKKEVIEGIHVFRLSADPFPIFMSEKLKLLLEENEITGYDLLEVKVT